MYKRPAKNNGDIKYSSLEQDRIRRTSKKHPIQLIISTLPQLAISFAILFFAFTSANASTSDFSGVIFYTSLLAGSIICAIFVKLQISGAEYKNWQQDTTTKQYIQIASVCSLISFFGLSYSLWPLFYVLTPLIILCGFTFVLSFLIISTGFLT